MRRFPTRRPRRWRPAILVFAAVIGLAVLAVWFHLAPMHFLRWRFWRQWFGPDPRAANFELAEIPAAWPPAAAEASRVEADRRFD